MRRWVGGGGEPWAAAGGQGSDSEASLAWVRLTSILRGGTGKKADISIEERSKPWTFIRQWPHAMYFPCYFIPTPNDWERRVQQPPFYRRGLWTQSCLHPEHTLFSQDTSISVGMDQLEPVKNKQDSWEWGGAESLAFSHRVNFLLSVHNPGRQTVTLLEMHRDTAVHNFHSARCGRTHPVGTDTGVPRRGLILHPFPNGAICFSFSHFKFK